MYGVGRQRRACKHELRRSHKLFKQSIFAITTCNNFKRTKKCVQWTGDPDLYCQKFVSIIWGIDDEKLPAESYMLDVFMTNQPYDVLKVMTENGRSQPQEVGEAMKFLRTRYSSEVWLRGRYQRGQNNSCFAPKS